ncbi:MAG TPA: hypothetical protein PKD79_03485 [Candidatus Doudnabacteria bacterium]|nr:hypothetical protein [Candidatus Doudnabacteria bacterium]
MKKVVKIVLLVFLILVSSFAMGTCDKVHRHYWSDSRHRAEITIVGANFCPFLFI